MSLNKQDRREIEKEAKENGYRTSSDGTKLINRETGGTIRFSDTGGSVSVNGSQYNSASDAKKSRNW